MALCSVLLMAACDRNVESFQPGEEPSQPDLARIFPAPPGGAGAAAEGDSERGARGAAREAFPPSRTESGAGRVVENGAASGSASSSAPIQGVIKLAPELVASQPGGAILFVIARPQGATAGPPLAVLRIPDPTFPLDFEIGPENVMIPSMQFSGSISLSARLDADGNAMTRAATDISSPVEESLTPGAIGVELMLSEQG